MPWQRYMGKYDQPNVAKAIKKEAKQSQQIQKAEDINSRSRKTTRTKRQQLCNKIRQDTTSIRMKIIDYIAKAYLGVAGYW